MIDRVLIVGLGSIGKLHLRLARELLPDADIRVLRHQACASIPEHSDGCFSSIKDAVAFAPQLAVIANPATYHLSVAMELAQAGVHLLVEKPLAAALDGVSQLLQTSDKLGVVLLTGYNLRFLPSLQRLRDLLNEHVIGSVLSVRCETGQYLPAWRPDTDFRQGVSARRELGGGALLELSHEIDYLRRLGVTVLHDVALALPGSDQYLSLSPARWVELAVEHARDAADGYFLSCTNTTQIEAIEPIERKLGIR